MTTDFNVIGLTLIKLEPIAVEADALSVRPSEQQLVLELAVNQLQCLT